MIKIEAAQRLRATKAIWVMPKDADLALEYRYEYALPQHHWNTRCHEIGAKYPVFKNEQDFIKKVKASKPGLIDVSVNNMTDMKTIDGVRDLVSGYQYPRDVDRIIEGFKTGAAMPMPIIISGTKGSWVLSGNTRSNIARILKIPIKAIWVDAT